MEEKYNSLGTQQSKAGAGRWVGVLYRKFSLDKSLIEPGYVIICIRVEVKS